MNVRYRMCELSLFDYEWFIFYIQIARVVILFITYFFFTIVC